MHMAITSGSTNIVNFAGVVRAIGVVKLDTALDVSNKTFLFWMKFNIIVNAHEVVD